MSQDQKKDDRYPTYDEIVRTSKSVPEFLLLAEKVDVHADARDNRSSFNQEWVERLRLARATLKDQIEINLPTNVAAASLVSILLDSSRESPDTIAEIEHQSYEGPSAEEASAQ